MLPSSFYLTQLPQKSRTKLLAERRELMPGKTAIGYFACVPGKPCLATGLLAISRE